MSVHQHSTVDRQPAATASDPMGESEEHQHGGRGHMMGMVLCCIPMVIAIIWILASSGR